MKNLIETVRRTVIIVFWGYGGDITFFLGGVMVGVGAGIRSLFDLEYARDMLG